MKEHSIRASDAQFIRLFRWIAGLQISSDAKLLFARLLDLAGGEQRVKASGRFLRAWLSWSDARLRRASSELEELEWLNRTASVTSAGDCAATEWKLPRIVTQTSEMVRIEGVSYTGHGVPRKDTVSHTGQSRPRKYTTQEGARARTHAKRNIRRGERPTLSGAERISIERRLRAERKRPTRAKIILGALMLRNHSELLPQLIAEAPPQNGELLRSVFPNAAKNDSPSPASSE